MVNIKLGKPQTLTNNELRKNVNNTHSYYKLSIAYILPYAAYVTIANLFSRLDPGINYTIRIVTVSAVLFWGWRWYVPFRGPGNYLYSIVVGIIFGLVGTLFWVALLFPFSSPVVYRTKNE